MVRLLNYGYQKGRNKLEINGREIGANFSPFIIAELSANHNGNFDQALKIVEAAKSAGADAVKIQTYTPDTITIDSDSSDFVVEGGLWNGRSLYDLYAEAHTPWEWHKPLFEYARKIGITIFSSPFDYTAVDLLMDLNAPAFKIASFEIVDLPLLKYVASTGKPMIISTGMADVDEIDEAVQTVRDGGCQNLVLLHCVSGYPAPASDYNLATIPDMEKRWGVPIGLSDHTLDNTTAIASVVMGASVIEKHFTLDRTAGGPDDSFSLEPKEFSALCVDTNTAWQARGAVDYGRKSSEIGNVKFRRSLYAVTDIEKGETITFDNVRSIRPGYGLPPKTFELIVGKKVKQNVKRGTPISFDLLS